MLYAVLGLIVLASIGLAIYALINHSELSAQIAALESALQEQEADYSAESDGLKGKLAAKVAVLQNDLQELAARHAAEIATLKKEASFTNNGLVAELARLEKFKHIPNVIEKSRRLEAGWKS